MEKSERLELISLVLPIYNVAPFLTRCLESLEKQTYVNIEVLMVDDCSTDESARICKARESVDKRFKYFCMPHNSGAGLARQFGIEHSKGEVIGFVDGDDWLSPDFVAQLHDVMISTGCDIVCSQYYFCYDDGKMNTPWPVTNEKVIIEKAEGIYRMARYDGIGTELWNKLYRKEIVRKAKMETCHYEDAFILLKYFMEATSICIYNVPLYFYYQRAGSLMNTPYSPEKEFNHFKLDMERSVLLADLGWRDASFCNNAMRKGIRTFKNFSLLPQTDDIKVLIRDTMALLRELSIRLSYVLSVRNVIETWLILHMTGIYTMFYRLFPKKRRNKIQRRYNISSAQIVKGNG